MNADELRRRLVGAIAFPVTPFHADLSLDVGGLRRNLGELLRHPVAAVVAAGGTGELYSLTPDEQLAVVRATIDTAKGRVPVLSGVAECSTAGAARYAADMETLGADGLMVLPAMVYKADAREALAHFRTVAKASDLPVMVYNNPIVYGVDITPEMFARSGASPSSWRRRKTFSSTTTELSTIMPTPSASPPSVIRLRVSPPP